MIKNDKKTENILEFILFGLFAFVLLYFCAGSSFRYAINPWNDSNAFFTVGKAMANGIVPYRDIFEQKGPLLYFIHCCSYWISNTSFTGVYIFEAVFATVFMIYIYKIANLYLDRFFSFATSVLTFTVVCNSFCFYYGDSAEEFALPTIAIGLYYLLKYFKTSEDIKLPIYLLTGFTAGCLVMIKFTLIGFWFGWMAIICIDKLFVKKEVKKAFTIGLIFVAGMIIACIPWVIYFAVNNSLKDFIYAYFVVNSTCYAKGGNFLNRIRNIVYFYMARFIHFPTVGISAVGCLLPLIFKKITDGKIISRLAVTFTYLSTVFFMFYGGQSFVYYMLPLMIYSCFIFIFGFSFIQKRSLKTNKKSVARVLAVALSAVIVLGCANFNVVATRTVRRGGDTHQKQVSDYINTHNPDGTLLVYYRLDSGVYLFNNYTKLFKYFEKQGIDYDKFPENIDEQNRYINEHEAHFVVAYSANDDIEKIYSRNNTLRTDYKLCKVIPFEYNNQVNLFAPRTEYCYLFELKDSIK